MINGDNTKLQGTVIESDSVPKDCAGYDCYSTKLQLGKYGGTTSVNLLGTRYEVGDKANVYAHSEGVAATTKDFRWFWARAVFGVILLILSLCWVVWWARELFYARSENHSFFVGEKVVLSEQHLYLR